MEWYLRLVQSHIRPVWMGAGKPCFAMNVCLNWFYWRKHKTTSYIFKVKALVAILKVVAVCLMINTVAHECWFATGIYRGLPSSARSWTWQRKCEPSLYEARPGFPQPLRLQADVCCSTEVWLLVRRKTESSIFRKGQPLARSCAMWWRKLLTSVVDATYQQCSFYHKRSSVCLGVEKDGMCIHGPLVEIQETT